MKEDTSTTTESSSTGAMDANQTVWSHLKWGWWSVLLFLTLGIVLEALHGFKIGAYLSPAHSTRRLMWTLAHAHGTLIGLMHLAFASMVRFHPAWPVNRRQWASAALRAAGLMIPVGFFLGGLQFYKADPGIGILLVPPGALLLLIAVFLTARQASSRAPQ